MSYDDSRKLSPLQMEQFIIHLKSEIEKYKSKTETYKRQTERNFVNDLKEKNAALIEEVEQLSQQVKDKEREYTLLKNKNEKLQTEVLGYQIHIIDLKATFESELGELKQQVQQLTDQEMDLLKQLEEAKQSIPAVVAPLETKKKHAPLLPEVEVDMDEEEDLIITPAAGFQTVKLGWSQVPNGIISYSNHATKPDTTSSVQNQSTSMESFLQVHPVYKHSSAKKTGTVDPFRHLR